MADKLTGEEWQALNEMLGHNAIMSGLRRIAEAERHSKHEAMQSEALGHGRAPEIIKLAAEARVWAEWEAIVKRKMELMAPQGR
jgi:hypothetical protein